MAVYTVHAPDDAEGAVDRADRTVFVREGFNFWGFVFGWLFLLWHRLWEALTVWVVLAGAAVLLWSRLALPVAPLVMLALVLHVFVGVEGNDLRRWRLERRRLRFVDVVAGERRDDIEYAFFTRQPEDVPAAMPAKAPVLARRDLMPAVIGMFPDERSA